MQLIQRQTIAFRPARRVFRTRAVPISLLTSQLSLAFRRSQRSLLFGWDARSSFQTRIMLRSLDGRLACLGQMTGGVRRLLTGADAPTYRLSYKLPRPITTRGFMAWVEVEQIAGNNCDLDMLGLSALEEPTLRSLIHNSVAFTAAASGIESAGDGVLSVSVSATGVNRAAFAGSASAVEAGAHTSTSITYGGNAMANMWNEFHDEFFCNAGYRLAGAGVAIGSQSVISTLSLGSVDEHMLGVVTMEGVDSTTPVGTHVFSSFPVTNSRSVEVLSVGSDDLVVDNLLTYGGVNYAIGDGQTQRNTVGPSPQLGHLKQSTQSGLSGGVMSWSWGNSGAASLGAVAFKSVVFPNDASVGIGRL